MKAVDHMLVKEGMGNGLNNGFSGFYLYYYGVSHSAS